MERRSWGCEGVLERCGREEKHYFLLSILLWLGGQVAAGEMKQAALSDEGMRRELREIEATLSVVDSESPQGKMLKSRLRSLKNRLAAKRSRECRKDYVRELEERCMAYEQENAALRSKLGLPPTKSFQLSGSSDDSFSCGASVASSRSTQDVHTSSSESQELLLVSSLLCPQSTKGHASSSIMQMY